MKGFRKKFINQLQDKQKFPNAEEAFMALNRMKAEVQEKKERLMKERAKEL